MNAKLSTIVFLPITVEVHDHRILSAIVAPKLVEMLFVKAAFFIKGVMKFVIGNACIASGV